jgi:hypothetical protein
MSILGLPMGYGSKTGLPLDIEGLMQVLASSTGPSDPDKAHTMLVYFARGNAKSGDEAKLKKLNVST